jgi:hypothetical protein
MADERAHLAQVARYIAETKEHIRKQERLIKRLSVRGALDEVEHFLSVLIGTLNGLERQRLLILDRLFRFHVNRCR